MTKDIEREAFEALPLAKLALSQGWVRYHKESNTYYPNEDFCPDSAPETMNFAWKAWQAAKAQAVPEGFVLVKKRNMIGNPNVDWLQAPKWAKYWLKDGHSNKYWWSSIRPVKDMDMNAFCWKGEYFAKEAPDFSYSGPWDKSLTSRKAMIEAQEPTND